MQNELNALKTGILSLLSWLGLEVNLESGWYQASAFISLLLIAWLMFKVSHFLINNYVTAIILKTKVEWDDELHKHGFFTRTAHLVPAVLIYLLSPLLFAQESLLLNLILKTTVIYVILVTISVGSALLNSVQDIYNASALAQRAPISGFIQVGKLLLAVVAILLIIANILDRSPLLLLSGLGAVTAVLLLIFRDAILGFVAGIQIAANRMVNTGDWVEMPKFNADGNVLEVGLTTVKIQNWDNTISTVPTYNLISDAVKNWRGMQDSAGRRIKRAVLIDIHSIRFCDESMLETFSQIRFIKRYIEQKKQILSDYNNDEHIDNQDLVNSRRLTNVGTFRAYLSAYLQNHPSIHQQMTLMVRQLPPTELGLPLEIYCFSADKNWVNYEGIQADIFDHIFAMLPVFQLRAYQRVSDVRPGSSQALPSH